MRLLRFAAFTLLAPSLLSAQVAVSPGAATPSGTPAPKPENAGRQQLTNYLDALAARQAAARRAAVAGIETPGAALARQRHVRETMLGLIGSLPDRVPLHARTTGSTQLAGFRIDKVMFDSQPNFPVTALLYVPNPPGEPGGGSSANLRFPAIVMAPGHGPSGKAGDTAMASQFARAGFVVLSYDPIGQGERLQYPDPDHPGQSLAQRPTGEHGEAGLQPTLLGDAVARFFLWDGMRAVDYLLAQPNVDPARIGAFGCSGGAAMTALLGALDPRVAAVGVACYTTSYDTLLPSIGPQDAEQSIPQFIARGLDFPDWVELAAPRPYAIIATTSDMFPFAGAQSTEAEARRFYGLLGAADKLAFLTGPGGHGNLRPITPQILAFFAKYLHPDVAYAAGLPPITDPFDPKANPPRQPGARPTFPPPPPASQTQVTPTGQVATSYPGAATVQTLTLARANAVKTPTGLSLARLQQAIRRVAGIAAGPQAAPQASPDGLAEGSRHPELLHVEPGIDIHAVFYRPAGEGKHPALLVLTEALGGVEDDARWRSLAAEGTAVLAVTPRPSPAGTEETKSTLLGPFYITELRAELVGKTLLGMRVEDTLSAVRFLSEGASVDPAQISAEASGHMALVLLHAAVLEPRFRHVTIPAIPARYRALVAQPLPQDAPQDILPGVLRSYEVDNLVAALGSRLSLQAK